MEKKLADRVAIVTGASRGIGAHIATRLAAEGAKVVLASRKAEALETVAATIKEAGGEALSVATHIGKVEQIQALVDATLSAYGRVDILVNNAATNPVFGPVMFCEEPALMKVFQVNVFGPFLLAKACLEPMQKAGYGKIVNLTSTAAFQYAPMLGVYGMSKAALQMMTQTLAAEWGHFGIRVNGVAPGLVKTDFSAALWNSEEILKGALERQAIKELMEPKDVVGAVAFLAGPESDFVTGHTMVVDAGGSI
ncbi:MAG: SDR family oxidoreductase [Candidatus Lernaella stagnicola]|nr:SDR family oxidoreductase [Candidatus Lernaella stagnicola]